jgi:hypothetical protein
MPHLRLVLVLAGALFQPAAAHFAGTWVADFNGVTFVRLELRTANGRLAGALSIGSEIRVDSNGVVDRVQEAPKTLLLISEVAIAGNVLSFTREDGDNPDRFRVRLTGDNTAELTIVLSEDELADLKAEGVPLPKPIPLRKLR